MNQRLELNFIKENGDRARLSLPNPDDTLQTAEIQAAMEAVIAAEVFAPGGSPLAVAQSARLVTTQHQEYDFGNE